MMSIVDISFICKDPTYLVNHMAQSVQVVIRASRHASDKERCRCKAFEWAHRRQESSASSGCQSLLAVTLMNSRWCAGMPRCHYL